MLAYVVRRVFYAFPILLGVNLLLFGLFFLAYSPDQMAHTILGSKRVSREQIEEWKRNHGYHLPRVLNLEKTGLAAVTETIFWQKSMRLFLCRFGKADRDGADIKTDILQRIPASLSITIPMFLSGMAMNLFFAMIVAFYRGTYIDVWALVLCVLMMSVSLLFYIIGGQYLVAIQWRLAPISGYDSGLHSLKFILLPIAIGVMGGVGAGVRYYRTVFLEEINKDYVRTARAKGLGEGSVLFKHALKNAMLPILTNVVVAIPFLIIGNLLLENFFGIPGLGSYLLEAIHHQDFAIIRAMVFMVSALYVVSLICVDISYTLVDPRIRLE